MLNRQRRGECEIDANRSKCVSFSKGSMSADSPGGNGWSSKGEPT